MRAAWTSWWSSADEARAGFEIGNPLRLFVELFAQAVVLALQSFNLARLAISGRPGRIVTRRSLRALRLHHPERTKLQRKVQVPNQCQHSTGPELLQLNILHLVGVSAG